MIVARDGTLPLQKSYSLLTCHPASAILHCLAAPLIWEPALTYHVGLARKRGMARWDRVQRYAPSHEAGRGEGNCGEERGTQKAGLGATVKANIAATKKGRPVTAAKATSNASTAKANGAGPIATKKVVAKKQAAGSACYR